jgi:signal transduction histidine kinase
VGGRFQMELENADYTAQYILIALVVITSISVFILIKMKGIEEWRTLIRDSPGEDGKQGSSEKLERIARKCMTLPYTIYLAQIIIPSLLLLVIHAFTTKSLSITTFKIWIAFFSFLTLAAVIDHIFSKRIMNKILVQISTTVNFKGKRLDLTKQIFVQMIPMFIVALLFTSLIGYSKLMKEKGDLIFKIYTQRLDAELLKYDTLDSRDDLEDVLRGVMLESGDDIGFIVSPNGDITGLDSEEVVLSPYFAKYMNEMSLNNKGRVYDYYGFDVQGVVKWVDIGGQTWNVGIRYFITSVDTVKFFSASFLILLFLCCLVLYYVSRSLAENISVVTEALKEIADGGDIDFNKKLVVTSNDEMGDLVAAFNRIQDREKENIRAIKEKQEMLMEQERLASLGQLIGGIAHNLKTPIMSISGAIEALKDLVTEYDESVEDTNVTDSDHHEIAAEMMEWLNKMKPHCSYMSDIISTVKGQAVQFSNSSSMSFTLGELIKRVEILMKHELKRYHCKINLDSHVDMNTVIKGELNNLVQIFDNIIINAIQAYGEESGVIDFKIVGDSNNIVFSFRDYGSGIPPEVQKRLFKEMYTTKGKNGTGLGLYMSYSTIRGRFGGNMWFESTYGKGSTFYISIPCNSNYGRVQEVME